MKKLAIIALLPFYLIVSVGVGINVHYCLGQVEYVVMLGTHGDCCCDDQEDMADCCEDEIFYQAMDENQQISPSLIVDTKVLIGEFTYPDINSIGLNKSTNKGEFHIYDLPPPDSPPIWLQNCSLTYYG
ncbi:MAG: hypothetical protein ABFS32_23380 [Bacteroidota bacterium]